MSVSTKLPSGAYAGTVKSRFRTSARNRFEGRHGTEPVVDVRVAQRGEGKTGFDFPLDPGVGLTARAFPQKGDAGFVEGAQHLLYGCEAHRGVGSRGRIARSSSSGRA